MNCRQDYEKVRQADRSQEPSPSSTGKVPLAPGGMGERAAEPRPSVLLVIMCLLRVRSYVTLCALEQPVPYYISQAKRGRPVAVGPHRGRGVPVLRGVFFQLEAVPLLVPMALSECLPVLFTRAVAEAAFCSLGDWLKVCRTPRGVVAEPRDSWLEAYRSKREPGLWWAGEDNYLEWPLLVWLTSSHPLGSSESRVQTAM